ncbi:C5a anaphylatoxin chemotactic receptor 1 [Triplophysa dalaica]|uniref:C5a anaphylatoxin chemotactic receptor 1 n=1 Tax=Triplophysa dalaica TaxID=1582913 RepID=UPI0024DF989D|nr:C5a anaphylatoxin chemotactic receptor 1 [Triplophysa dalaica]
MEDSDYFIDFNDSDCWSKNCSDLVNLLENEVPVMGPRHWFALICYSIVFLLGVPGNGLVVWVTAFRMPNSVNAQWFLNLAIADLLCCLSLPLLMVPLTQDQHWPFGPLACKILHGLFSMMMYCSVLLLVAISLDRFLLVTKPVWCQNRRNPRIARCVCFAIWVLALLGSSPQFAHMEEIVKIDGKKLCVSVHHSKVGAWAVTVSRSFLSFVLPFMIICVSHWKVYTTTSYRRGQRGNDKSARTLRVILTLVFSFFLCWMPLHIVDLLQLIIYKKSNQLQANLLLGHVLALCLAYINSCMNPLLYVCLGRGFKENLISSLRSVLHFASEAPPTRISMTAISKTTTTDGQTCSEKPL